jgi:hypothetical protein
MTSKKRKAESQLDAAQTAPTALPELPRELWSVIFNHVHQKGGDLAQLRLVNKSFAKEWAYRLYAEHLSSQFEELKQKRLALVASRNAQVTGNDERAQLTRQSNTTFGHGMLLSDAGFQHFVWNVICLYNSGEYDDALMAGRCSGTQGRLAPLKMCMEAMHKLLQSS